VRWGSDDRRIEITGVGADDGLRLRFAFALVDVAGERETESERATSGTEE
jgi:hypothetical protein